MAYEKPVVVTLTVAAPAIRSGVSDHDGTKASGTVESILVGNSKDGTTNGSADGTTHETSTSSGAYEADE